MECGGTARESSARSCSCKYSRAGENKQLGMHANGCFGRYALQRRLSSDPALSNISVLGVDPGGMPSGLTRRGGALLTMGNAVLPLLAKVSMLSSPNGPLRTTQKSAGDVLRAAFDTETLGIQPKAVYLNGSDLAETSLESRDERKQNMLWKDSVVYAGLQPADTVLQNWR